MREIVDVSHDAGLTVQASPWGVGRTFGGEAESRWVTFHTRRSARCSTMGGALPVPASTAPPTGRSARSAPTGCSTAASTPCSGTSPQWMVPRARRHRRSDSLDLPLWRHCAERFGRSRAGRVDAGGAGVPRGVGRRIPARSRRARPLRAAREHGLPVPATGGNHGISDWNLVAELPGLATFATDPYLEVLERIGRAVRAPLRAVAARDLRAARSAVAALAAELRPHPRRDPRARGSGRCSTRRRDRRPVDVGPTRPADS